MSSAPKQWRRWMPLDVYEFEGKSKAKGVPR